MKKKEVLIVGAGASGLMAAIMAARGGAKVTILEQNDRPGKKIAATGNGKCNLTNLELPADAFRGFNPAFAKKALEQFSVFDTIKFFSELGIYTVNKNGYLYPHSGQAQSVTDVLCMEARNLGVTIKTKEKICSVFYDHGWCAKTDSWTYRGDALILANGSKASNIAGSDGSGYQLAQTLGHHLITPLPALTALKCSGKYYQGWAGVRTEGSVTLCLNGIPLKTQQGELQLTEYGISGIPVFQISRYAIRALAENCQVSLLVNFLPGFTKESFGSFMDARKKNCPYKTEKELLVGLFPEKLISVLLRQKNLKSAVLEFPLNVSGSLSFEQAQVCSGGVDTEEVEETSMESKLHKGLFFAGELLDIDGTCGGYNLQWAWSSGAAAGIHAAK